MSDFNTCINIFQSIIYFFFILILLYIPILCEAKVAVIVRKYVPTTDLFNEIKLYYLKIAIVILGEENMFFACTRTMRYEVNFTVNLLACCLIGCCQSL